MTDRVVIQKIFVPIGYFVGANGYDVMVLPTNEWRRPLEDMANLVNQHEETLASLNARLVAIGA